MPFKLALTALLALAFWAPAQAEEPQPGSFAAELAQQRPKPPDTDPKATPENLARIEEYARLYVRQVSAQEWRKRIIKANAAGKRLLKDEVFVKNSPVTLEKDGKKERLDVNRLIVTSTSGEVVLDLSGSPRSQGAFDTARCEELEKQLTGVHFYFWPSPLGNQELHASW
jgi:hypothetical protein